MSNIHPLKVTVLDTATIFEGIDTLYRYDLPGTGLEEGWALPAVVDQIREMYAAVWPDVEVIVDGSETATDMLTRTLLNKGVTAYSIEALTDPALESCAISPFPEDRFTIERPTAGKSGRRFTAFHAIVAGIAAVVLAGAGMLINNAMRVDVPTRHSAAETTAAEHGHKAQVVANSTTPSTTAAGPMPQVATIGNVVLSVPEGFEIAPREDGMFVAHGPDPELRILVAADPIYNVAPEAVRREIDAMVEQDSTLSAQSDEHVRGEGVVTQTYREEPGDGSIVQWITWVQGEYQFSVGCHSRHTATIPQKAACRMAAQTLELKN